MSARENNIPDEILYHFVTQQQSIDQLFHSLYERPNELTKQHFLTVNSHLDQQVSGGFGGSVGGGTAGGAIGYGLCSLIFGFPEGPVCFGAVLSLAEQVVL